MAFRFQPDAAVAQAEKLVRQGKFAAAIRIYERLDRDQQGGIGLTNTLAELYLRVGRTHEACQLFRKVAAGLEQQNQAARAAALLKKILRLEGESSETLRWLSQLLIAQGQRIEARATLASLLSRAESAGDWKMAQAALEDLVRLEPSEPQWALKQVEILIGRGELPSAKARLHGLGNQLLSQLHANRGSLQTQADRLARSGRVAAAIPLYERFIAEHPEDMAAKEALADLYIQVDRQVEACQLLREAATGWEEQKQWLPAIELWRRLARLDGEKLQTLQPLVRLLLLEEQRDEARLTLLCILDRAETDADGTAAAWALNELLQLDPEAVSLRVRQAKLLLAQGDLNAAETRLLDLGEVLLRAPAADGIEAGAAPAVLELEEAIPLFELLVRERSASSDLASILARLYRQAGRSTEASQLYRQLGAELEQRNQIDAAIEFWREAMHIDGERTDTCQALARLLLAEGRNAEAQPLLVSLLDRAEANADWTGAKWALQELTQLAPADLEWARREVTLLLAQGDIPAANERLHQLGDRLLDRSAAEPAGEGELAAAISLFERLVRDQPGNAGLVDRLAALYLQAGRATDACRQLQEMATALEAQGQLRDAIERWQQVARLEAENLTALQALARLWQAEENIEAARPALVALLDQAESDALWPLAEEALEALLHLDPDEPEWVLRQARLLIAQGESPAAEERLLELGDQLLAHARAAEPPTIESRPVGPIPDAELLGIPVTANPEPLLPAPPEVEERPLEDDSTEAIPQLERLVGAHPDDLVGKDRLAALYLQAGRIADACHLLQDAATTLEAQGQLRDAIERWQQVARLEAENLTALQALARLWQAEENIEAARPALVALLDQAESDALWPLAEEALEALLHLDPDEPEWVLRQARLLIAQGESPAAEERLLELGDQLLAHARAAEPPTIESRPVGPIPDAELLGIPVTANPEPLLPAPPEVEERPLEDDSTEAIPQLERLVGAHPDDLVGKDRLAALYLQAGRIADACHLLQDAATTLEAQGQLRDAIERWQQVARLEAENLTALQALARLWQAEENIEAARPALVALLDQAESDALWPLAEEALEALLHLDPDEPEWVLRQASLLCAQGETATAREILQSLGEKLLGGPDDHQEG